MRGIFTLGLVTLLLVAACAPPASPAAALVSAPPADPMPSRVAPAPEARPAGNSRYFAETGFNIGNRYFAKFFRERGGLRTFGPPISRQFRYLGFPAQLFDTRLLLLNLDNSVFVVPLGNSTIFPFTQVDGMVLPGVDDSLLAQMPQDPNAPGYAEQTLARTLELVPDEFNGMPVNFRSTYLGTVVYEEAFPNGDQPPEVLPYLAFQVWGRPLSQPTPDPNDGNRIYQRFENGIMMFDATTGQTTSLPVGRYLKAVLTGQDLPADLEQAAQGTRFLRQYQEGAGAPALARPDELPDSNLADAFAVEPAPTDWASLGITYSGAPLRASSPDYGISVFLWGEPGSTGRDLQLVKDLGFNWIRQMFQWRDIEGVDKGVFDWSEADRIVQAANAQGLKIIARFDFSPEWSQTKIAPNGPPDDMNDFGDFIYAFVDRYGPSRNGPGRVDAIQVWNEPNLAREWGGRPINQDQAAEYVNMLRVAYQAAKQADPQITVISAGLTPTGTDDDTARPDDVYLQWMYDAGAAAYFDVLGAHGAGYKAPPEMSPEEVAADPSYGGHASFAFRR
ncbi:MAG: cellulase family glycosylhydrolase, partial [Chloroflexi bacterium]|nr:cellulase family glycosylhydrolase [Chloroflexota bacterium]